MWIKQTALFFTLVYLVSTGLITVHAEGHALTHDNHEESHAKQHASFICTWMCAASSVVHTAEQTLKRALDPTFCDIPVIQPEEPPPPQPLSTNTIRPPPFFHS